MNNFEEVRTMLTKHGQEHLLDYIKDMPKTEAEKLIEQIKSIDFELIEDLYKNLSSENNNGLHKKRIISPVKCGTLKSFDKSAIDEFYETGVKILAENKAAVVTMAGGQGSRLGHDGPKGTFKIGAPIDKTLFQLQAERLIKLCVAHNCRIPWYIMTSEENHADTISHFESKDYFGYPVRDIFFFKQGMLPMLGLDGKVLLKEKNEIYFGPDGNGGVFLSLKKSGALSDMSQRGIQWVFFTGIDNALVKMADPVFIGYTAGSGMSAGSKSSPKTHPEEKAGVFCKENGKTTIVEYTEMPKELIGMTDADGELLFGDINILVHLFKLSKLQSIADAGLPYHKAVKKAAYIDRNGHKIEVKEANSLKFESFIFDAFELLDDVSILRVERDKEFAPIKNKTGEDSPESAIRFLTLLIEK